MDRNEEVEQFAKHLRIKFDLLQPGRPVGNWEDLTAAERKGWIAVAITALQANKPQYRLEVVTNHLDIAHLRLKPPRGGEIIMAGEQLYSVSGARRTARHLAAAARRGLRVVEVAEVYVAPTVGEVKP